MAIQFQCPGCQRPIQVPDATEGKSARCPSCGAISEIPYAGASPEHGPPAVPLPEPEGVNPFQSPTVEAGPAVAVSTEPRLVNEGRDGPAWESPGPSLRTLLHTTKDVLLSPQATFRRMICYGGFGRPVGFAVVGGLLSGLVSAVGPALMMAGAGWAAQNAGNRFGPLGLLGFTAVVQQVLGGVIGVMVGVFAGGGILHLLLLLLNGARREFEATLRVVGYVSGSLWIFSAIPMVGPILGYAWGLYVGIVGIAEVHEIPAGKAALAVLLPLAICFASCFLLALVALVSIAR